MEERRIIHYNQKKIIGLYVFEMAHNKIVNIVNFVRGEEPRMEMDLLTPVIEEIKLNKKYGFENTFLLQYDAMVKSEFVDLFLKEKDEHMELGIWIEMARCLVEKAGIPWRSKRGWDWDWYVNPGFLPAYTKEEKERIIDIIMEKFKELFGYYPKSAGSWLLDSESVMYMTEKYGLEAFCICREQQGTDAYTLWGGYYNGPYYPSKQNILHPAQTKKEQINAPVIRMLGPDPIYSYYEKKKEFNKIERVLFSLEPVWPCGYDPGWVKWYFKNFVENESMEYNYTQVGQENSFGWDNIKKGLPMQMEYLYQLEQAGKVKVEKLYDTGRRYREQYDMTPASVYSALDDWTGLGNQSVWYSCKNYRLNLFSNNEEVWIRDIHKFDENYRDVYLDEPCKENDATLDALPVIDGFRFSDEKVKAGLFFGKGTIQKTWREGSTFFVRIFAEGKEITLKLDEHQILMESEDDFIAKFVYKAECEQIRKVTAKKIYYRHNKKEYSLYLKEGNIDVHCFKSDNGKICLDMV